MLVRKHQPTENAEDRYCSGGSRVSREDIATLHLCFFQVADIIRWGHSCLFHEQWNITDFQVIEPTTLYSDEMELLWYTIVQNGLLNIAGSLQYTLGDFCVSHCWYITSVCLPLCHQPVHFSYWILFIIHHSVWLAI